jgi:hypothetical protein
MKLRNEMESAVMRLLGRHARMQDCYDLNTLKKEVDDEVNRLVKMITRELLG